MSYWVKDTQGLLVKDRSLESPIHQQRDYITPNDQFFVCNSGSTPQLSASDYSLTITGDAVSVPLSLTYDELRSMPQRTVPAVLECAGNHRAMFQTVMGETLDKRPQLKELLWETGAVGMAVWRGVPLRDVLKRAGISSDAYHVCPKGGETDSLEGEVKMPMPVEKAMHEDTILALEMNDEPLPADHGFPVRAIVPGWIGSYSVKWIKEIEVTQQHLWVTRNTEYYVLMGDEWSADEFAPAKGPGITEQNIKSSLALPWSAKLSPGEQTIRGYARSSGSAIARVLWSDDNGAHWSDAALTGPNEKFGWVQFTFQWHAACGSRTLLTRAFDCEGRAQPDSIPFNNGGYLFNAVHPHPVNVLEE